MRKFKRDAGAWLAGFGLAVMAVTGVQAEIVPSPAPKVTPAGLHRIDGRCPPGFHEVGAMNGNGYRCVPDHQ
jgi:hypothetical protein